MHGSINIESYCGLLKSGKTLLYPTDTIWGLGCDATNDQAVEKIYSIKQRAYTKPLIALVADTAMLAKYVDKLPAHIDEILKSDLATTIIYPKGKGLAKGVISNNGSVALRIPRSCFALELIKAFGKPIVSTSANISDWPIPKSYSDIHPSILEQVDEVVPLDKEKVAQLPSRILQLLPDGTFITLR